MLLAVFPPPKLAVELLLGCAVSHYSAAYSAPCCSGLVVARKCYHAAFELLSFFAHVVKCSFCSTRLWQHVHSEILKEFVKVCAKELMSIYCPTQAFLYCNLPLQYVLSVEALVIS